jgi:hypothetical protein
MELYLEFMISQKSNSGVYVQGLYKVQILDSHGPTHLTGCLEAAARRGPLERAGVLSTSAEKYIHVPSEAHAASLHLAFDGAAAILRNDLQKR